MACRINRNESGLITTVFTKEGKESKLFKELDSNLFQTDSDVSLSIYMNSLTEEITNKFKDSSSNTYDTGEPIIYYKDEKGVVFEDMETLMLKGVSGKITFGFQTPDNTEFIPVAKINTEANAQAKFLTDKVKEGVLSPITLKDKDGVNKYQGKGEFEDTKQIMAMHVQKDLALSLGITDVTIDKEGVLTIADTEDYIEIEFETGQKKVVKKSTIPEILANNNIKNKAEISFLHAVEFSEAVPLNKKTKSTKNNTESEKDLIDNMFSFLESLGFTVTSLEGYRKNYNTKYGKDVDINAITDVSNKLVAFSNGMINIEDLTEEVAHIAIEAYTDQNSIAEATVNAHMLDEYQEYSSYYRTKYAPFFEGAALEEQVRKEVLGKALKNAFLKRFDTQNKNEEQQGVIEYLATLWDKFITFIRGNIKEYHISDINDLNQRIIDSIVNKDSEIFDEDIMNPDAFYYAASSKTTETLQTEMQKVKSNIETLFKKGLQSPVPNQAALNKLSEAYNASDIVSSVGTILGITTDQLEVLLTDTNEAFNRQEMITKQDSARYRVLKYDLIPSLENIKADLTVLKGDQTDQRIKQNIDFIISGIDAATIKLGTISPKVKTGESKQATAMLEDAIEAGNLTEEEASEVRKDAEDGLKDQSFFGFKFGISSHSKNPWIQLMHKEIVSLQTKVRMRMLSKYNTVIPNIVKKGLQKFQKQIINYDDDGKTYYFLSPRDYSWYDKQEAKETSKSIAKLLYKKANPTAEEIAGVEEKLKTQYASEILSMEDYDTHKKELKNWRNTEGTARRFKEEYYEKGQERFKKAKTSEQTIDYLQNKNISKFERVKKYINKDNTIDRSKMTNGEKREEANELKQHKRNKSVRDYTGELRIGLKEAMYNDLTEEERISLPEYISSDYGGPIIVLSGEMSLEDLPNESRRALDLFNLDALFVSENQDNTKTRNPVKNFFNRITEIETEGQSAYDWVMANASMTLSEKFYDDADFGVTYMEAAQEYIYSIEDDTQATIEQNKLDEIIRLQKIRKEIIKFNKKGNNALEVDVHHMTNEVRVKLLYLEQEISIQKASLKVPTEFFDNDSEGEVNTEIKLNSDFEKMKTESGQSTYELALEHMTDYNKSRTKAFAKEIDALINGRTLAIDKNFDSFLGDLVEKGLLSGSTPQENIEIAKEEFAKKNIAGYFKRYEPTGYSEFIEDMQNGKISMEDVIKGKLAAEYPVSEYISINPEYSWNEDNNNDDMINPNYVAGGHSVKPKKLNDKFFSFFGIKKEDYLALKEEDLRAMTPTQNKEAYELLILITDLREESQKNYGDEAKVNKYLMVQLSKNTFEKTLNFNKGTISNIKDSFTDILRSKKDEKEYGEETEGGSAIKVIPKYYQSKLESAEILTENILEAAMLDYKASINYDETLKSESKLRALDAKIKEQRFRNTGNKGLKSRITVKGEVSNYYKKSQEMMDYYLYGIKESRRMVTNIAGVEVDMTQAFNTLTKYVAKLNLAFNAISDVTSLTTGVYNNVVDMTAGDYYTKEAFFKAHGQLPVMLMKYFAESGNMVKNSDMHHILEFMGIEDAENKLRQSSSGKLVRALSKSEFAMAKAANMPVTPAIVLALMHDTKLVDGKFISFNQFSKRKRQENNQLSANTIKAEWNKNKDSFYNNIKIDKEKGIQMGENFKEKFGENAEKFFEDTQIDLTTKANQVIAGVDGRLTSDDQVAAQRDALTNAALLHNSWFIINLTRKFKGKHYNIATGQIEEGHYKGVLKRLVTIPLSFVNKNKLREELEAHQIRNMKRLGADVTLIVLLTGLANAMLMGDDDDDTFIENFAQLIALRTVAESQSQTIVGIAETMKEKYKNPIVQLGPFANIKDAIVAAKKGDSEKAKAKMLQLVMPGKRYSQLTNLEKTLNDYVYHNEGTLKGIDRSKYAR